MRALTGRAAWATLVAMRFMGRFGWVALAAAIGGLAAPAPAHACSCRPSGPGRFYLGAGETLPRDAVGIPYYEPQFLTDRQRRDQVGPRLDPGRVTLLQRSGAHEYRSEFTIFSRDGLEFIVPGRRMRAGDVFVVRVTGRDSEDDIAARVVVQAEALPLTGATVALGEQEARSVGLAAGRGSCSESIDAVVRELRVALPDALEPYRDHLTYTTLVDGKLWQEASSMCQFIVPGRTWTEAPGTDRLFSACIGDQVGLSTGTHEVAVELATPDGTHTFVTPAVRFTIDCGADPATPAVVEPATPTAASCNCTGTRGAPGLLWVCALILRRRARVRRE